ncbi:hypothetical protein pb186bvf_000777 [Paramecium bursaria]
MEVKYRPPLNNPDECDFLESNFLSCLREKSVKDDLPKRYCNVEQVLWFFLECPNRSDLYEQKDTLRQIYIKEKQKEIEGNPTKPMKRKF